MSSNEDQSAVRDPEEKETEEVEVDEEAADAVEEVTAGNTDPLNLNKMSV